MAVNKVVYDGSTLIDLTEDTVTPETLAEGVTAHAASGETIIGTMQAGKAGVCFVAQDTEPEDTSAAWIDTSDNTNTKMYTYGTEDLEAGVTPLAPGTLYFVYE